MGSPLPNVGLTHADVRHFGPETQSRPNAAIAGVVSRRHHALMKRLVGRSLVAGVLSAVMSSQATAKSGEERWLAYSKTALSITGNIFLSPTQLRTASVKFPLRVAANLPDFESDVGTPVPARVLFVTRRMNPKLLNGNVLGCGKPIRWIVVWRYDHGQSLGMNTFTGDQMPTTANDAGFCASYFYSRK